MAQERRSTRKRPESPPLPLTARQREILAVRALYGGHAGATAHALGLGHRTIENTCTEAYRRLGVITFVDALLALGWLRVPSVYAPPGVGEGV